MGPAGDLLSEFRTAGRTLFSFGLVRETEGNLSMSDGHRLVITRTGSSLAELGSDDVLEGTLDEPPAGSSTDLAVHLATYRERGPGAVAHAHPPGTVPERQPPGADHGSYVHALTLADAVAEQIRRVRDGGAA
jgi:hypothetical protein